jgi:hypothetical protein
MSLNMTRAEREDFLAGVHVGILAIDQPGTGPLAVPIWYAYQRGGDVFFGTGRDSVKATLLDAAGRASLVAQTETRPYRYVSIEGPVRIYEGPLPEPPMPIRYLGDEAGRAYIEAQGSGVGVTYALTPERWLTVDYAKR